MKLVLALASLAAFAGSAAAKAVFAHVIVGVAQSYTVAQWESDIALAQAADIDAFVLNITPPWSGSATETQVANAFKAAESTGFKLFFSFDYKGNGQAWSASDIITVLQTYASNDYHYKHNSLPLVSTFEGTDADNINDWSTIKSQVSSDIFLVPDWTSLGTTEFATHLDIVDGAFSWDMWPEGPNNMTNASDVAWTNAIGSDKAYMMGVSPWFYTDLPGYNKAWVWRGDSMWHERWQQAIDLQPEFVEIVTWNDYGESHYIGPIWSDGIPQGDNINAHTYVDGMPHDAWRDLLPYYISQYKTGSADVTTEKLQYWYRLTPGAAGTTEATGNNCKSDINIYGYQTCYDPNEIAEDGVFVTALLSSPATVTIKIGDNDATSFEATAAGANHFSRPFNGQTGKVVISIVRDSATVLSGTGEAILEKPTSGVTNYNAWVGGVSA
ncbi:glycoside hydrolase family 71 protein [Aplosporella prunicola CBS 121167]|uniref:Glycoside hydrolase family 71 protein n=1 Tax=Aplosporella prunicola CBS 121167 TaxID=1176127 RepID=A0A6A6B8R6_9PEZI|nr:glycoside hydrolase family 71 protein [Aplosporella prunicola CBS 121167]KAF2139594.1 glycoside hydrolase family 71 protein [Aplosporella prunicola CBS 121167]